MQAESMAPTEHTPHRFLKGVAISLVAGLALAGCSYQNTAEMNSEDDKINRELGEEVQRSNQAIPDYAQEKKALFKDVGVEMRGEDRADWSRKFIGTVFNQLDESDTDSFRYIGLSNNRPEWVWDNSASRSGKISNGAALSVRYDEGTLHVKKVAKTKDGNRFITTDVAVKTGHLHRTEPDSGDSRTKWSGWIEHNAGQLAMKKLHGEVHTVKNEQTVDTVDLWLNYKGNSTKPSAFAGFVSQGVQPVDPDIQTKRLALNEFMEYWDEIKRRPAA